MTAFFAKKNKEVVEDKKEVSTTSVKEETKKSVSLSSSTLTTRENIARILMNPRITEKATLHTDKGVYVFDVVSDSNKKQIKEAIYSVYKVHPVKVRVTKIAKKSVRNARTGMKGTKAGGKKAYIYLKKGDSISIM